MAMFRGVTTDIIGPSLHREAAGIGENTVAAWEACGFGEAEHDQWLLRVSLPFHLEHGMSLVETNLTGVVVLPLPAGGGRNRVAIRRTPTMATATGATCRRWHSRAPVAR